MRKIICIALAIWLPLYPGLLYAQPQRDELLNQREELLNRLKELEKKAAEVKTHATVLMVIGAILTAGGILIGLAGEEQISEEIDRGDYGATEGMRTQTVGVVIFCGGLLGIFAGWLRYLSPEESRVSREKKEIERKLRSIKWDLERLEEKEVVVSKKERLLKEHPEWSDNVVKAIARETSKRRIEAIEEHPEWIERALIAICKGKIFIGMTREQVIASWGRPEEINESVGVWGTHEQWVYYRYYLYFENGRLTAWQEEREIE